MTFVKSQNTKVPTNNSRNEIEKLLRRYGASGISVQQTFDEKQLPELVTVTFVIPDSPGSTQKVPVSLPISVKNVYKALYPSGAIWRDAAGVQQAERVAYRNLVLWIDAALSAAAIGLQTITQAFYAHTVIKLESGQTVRLSEYIDRVQGQLAPGVRALLATPAERAD